MLITLIQINHRAERMPHHGKFGAQLPTWVISRHVGRGPAMSVLSPGADMALLNRDVRRVPKPDLIGSPMPARGQYARLRQLDRRHRSGTRLRINKLDLRQVSLQNKFAVVELEFIGDAVVV